MFEGLILGLHLFSAHPGLEGYNNVNPGVYAIAPSGFTVGTYKNSYSNQSGYVGWTWRWDSLTLTLAGASGYAKPVMPLLAVGYTLPGGFRILAGPTDKKTAVFHLMWEKGF